MSLRKDMMALVDDCLKKGWRVTQTAKGHYKFLAPSGGGVFFCAGTPSDYRAIANTKARIKQAEQRRVVQ